MTEAGQQIGQRGQALYDQTLKAQVEEGNHGKFLILDVNTGDYEIDPEDLTASKRLLERRPDAVLFGVRVGYRAAYRLGWDQAIAASTLKLTLSLASPIIQAAITKE